LVGVGLDWADIGSGLGTVAVYPCGSLQTVDGLTNCTKLTSLHLSKCLNVKPKPSPVHMTTREQVVAYQERIKKAMK